MGSIRANTSLEAIEGAVVVLLNPAMDCPSSIDISPHTLSTFGSLK